MNRYFDEVMVAHVLIADWLSGRQSSPQVCETLLGRFSRNFSMITTQGAVLDIARLSSFFRAQCGARQGLEIDILDMQLVADYKYGAVVTYQERQHVTGQPSTLRFSTVVFEVDNEGRLLWRHLHETASDVI
ncbi:DUF4440 domain-containing protein [Rosenbergiella collisarenosi]|uniref:DUF4440 domain-containing protein n=1 Tax=Rosenbergiella collisarenosi TaxID=1544695 RepID=UPI001F4F13A8|nr:DUF4440 domain-containing protein [Rosenbergiella collisarenosi]